MVSVVSGCLLLASIPACRAQSDGNARYFFGHIEAPCHPSKDNQECVRLENDIRNLGTACQNVDRECKEGERILRKLFGDTYRDVLPDFMVYLEQQAGRTPDGKPSVTFKAHKPVLMWRNQNTPHLYGVRDIYAIVFSQRKACIDGTLATDYKSEPNPFSAILAVVGKNIDPEKKEDTRAGMTFSWYPLDGNPGTQGMWYAVARTGVDVNSTNRIIVRYRQPKAAQAKDGADDKTAEQAAAKPRPKPKPKPKPEPGLADECGAPQDEEAPPVYAADFLAASGFFSNSPDSRVSVALALGATFNARDTSIASGGSKQALNGYALAKFYLVRPRLRTDPGGTGHHMSWGAFVGTNIGGSAFDELVFGLSMGHVIGNVGLVAGINSIEGKKDTDQGRKQRAFIGLDYSF